MKPAHPDTSYQGFAVVKFNIDTSGKPKNIKAINSECAIKRDKEGNIVLKRCPFFKSSAVNAAKFITKDGLQASKARPNASLLE